MKCLKDINYMQIHGDKIVYTHYIQTYNHPHVHAIRKNYTTLVRFDNVEEKWNGSDVLAYMCLKETLSIYKRYYGKQAVLNDPVDIYRPIRQFYLNCTMAGKLMLAARQLLFVFYTIPGLFDLNDMIVYRERNKNVATLDVYRYMRHYRSDVLDRIHSLLELGNIPVGHWFKCNKTLPIFEIKIENNIPKSEL